MIYVKVELWPGGDRRRSRLLHEGVVYNDGTGTPTRGNYVARFSKKGGFKHAAGTDGLFRDAGRHDYQRIVEPAAGSVWLEGGLSGFPRKKYGAWQLLFMCLHAAGILEKMSPEREQG